MSTVAAVVVTFNRKNLLIECIQSLLNQTEKINKLILIDNASSDGTHALLEESGLLKNELIDYRLMDHNLGGAGGFHEGVKIAHEAGYEWIWVMDDDAEPLPDSLEKMKFYFLEEETVATCPLVTNGKGTLDIPSHHRGWVVPFDGINVIRPVSLSELDNKSNIYIDHCSFVGLCFRSSAIEAIGLPRADFFIHFDDFEFCTRLVGVGKINLIANSFIKHKEAAAVGIRETKFFFGRSSSRIKYEKLWINYFGYRNKISIFSRKKYILNSLPIIITHLKLLIGILIYDDNKLKRINFWNSALTDGLFHKFDNKKPRAILKR